MKLSKTYDPGTFEHDIYALWEKAKAFEPRGNGDGYCIVVPPPNANGNLHIGHALTIGVEDIAIRYHRLKGDRTLLVPGADHAGFETWVVYEKKLSKEGKSRFSISRESLYQQIWDFVAQNKDSYESQFRRLGASVDWSRYVYTLDEKIIRQAYATFKKMWSEGLIYRGERLVNYCTYHRTGFADIEVAYSDVKTPLYYLKYGPFVLATTRPETKFGDTAVAVHPDDKRYKQWVGKTVDVPGANGTFSVQVVADKMVDPHFGTGVVKITPAHSFDDWEVAQRHNLPLARVIEHDGTMNHKAGPFAGLTVLEARAAVVQKLQELDLIDHIDDNYVTRVGKCYKCGTVIEPMLMDQWFVDMKPLARPAIAALKAKAVSFYPDVRRKQLITYLENLRDWNISRQIAWGIPIPAFQNVDDSDDWIYDDRVTQETIEVDGKTYRRDPDVFDTWFSSSSWPYATLNYPDGQDFKDFYPLSLMETGADILYPWVSRMLMFGLYNTHQVPFKEVYLHGLVLDQHGQKMSKSKGNVLNPMEAVEEYGSDALRMGLIAGQTPGNNQPYSPPRVIAGRNFCNKLWNIARYIESIEVSGYTAVKPQTAADYWILHKLQQSTRSIGEAIERYDLSAAFDQLYHFVWDDFADWYIEASKAQVNAPLLGKCLRDILALAHPFAPFVTETIYQTITSDDSILAMGNWPIMEGNYAKQAADFETVRSVITEIRLIIQNTGARDVALLYSNTPVVAENSAIIQKLAGLKTVQATTDTGAGFKLTAIDGDCWLDISADDLKQYEAKLIEQRETTGENVLRLQARLANRSYVENAPPSVVADTREQLAAAKTHQAALDEEYTRLTT